jgi:hypothetical protein
MKIGHDLHPSVALPQQISSPTFTPCLYGPSGFGLILVQLVRVLVVKAGHTFFTKQSNPVDIRTTKHVCLQPVPGRSSASFGKERQRVVIYKHHYAAHVDIPKQWYSA